MLSMFFRVMGVVLLAAAAALITLGIVGVYGRGGWGAVADLMSPFNVVNWVVTCLTLAPGIACFWLADRLRQR